jgi:hypothetical protein
MTPNTLIIGALIAFMLYRRIRSHVGQQPFSAGRAIFRVVFLSLIAVLLLMPHLSELPAVEAAAGGVVLGIVLGFYALRHTAMEVGPAGTFYTPNLYIGLTVTALVLFRVGYRLSQLRDAGAAGTGSPGFGAMQSPLTLGLFFLLAGYYAAYYIGLLRRERELTGASGELNA